MKTAHLTVTGMTCGQCVDTVESSLRDQPGVIDATVDLDCASAEVQYEEGIVSPSQLVAAVQQGGYGADLADIDVSRRP